MGRRVVTGLVVLALGAGASACGSDGGYANRPRPPDTIVVSAAITQTGVTISPRRFGAGPIELIVANLTTSARELTLQTDQIGGTGGGIDQSTGPINPGDTTRLKAELKSGRYAISVDGARPASLRVGAPRPSSQDQLLQP